MCSLRIYKGSYAKESGLNLDPFMIHETFLYLTETAFGSHPCRVVSATYRTLRPFHGGNTGSNPVGDANNPKKLRALTAFTNPFIARWPHDKLKIRHRGVPF